MKPAHEWPWWWEGGHKFGILCDQALYMLLQEGLMQMIMACLIHTQEVEEVAAACNVPP